MMRRASTTLLILLSLLLLSVGQVSADANDIIKWCETGGDGVRYASANIKLEGYTKCGELKATKTCDAVGTRFISPGNAKRAPHGYLDCDLGPRIQIERHIELEKEVLEFQDFREGSDGKHIKNEIPEELKKKQGNPYAIFDKLLQGAGTGNRNVELFHAGQDAKKRKKLRRERSRKNKRSKRRSGSDKAPSPLPVGLPGGMDFTQQFGPLLKGFGIDPSVLNPPKNKADMRKQKEAIKKLYNQMTPEEKDMLKQLIGTSDIDKLLGPR